MFVSIPQNESVGMGQVSAVVVEKLDNSAQASDSNSFRGEFA